MHVLIIKFPDSASTDQESLFAAAQTRQVTAISVHLGAVRSYLYVFPILDISVKCQVVCSFIQNRYHHLAMSFGWGVGDIIAISKLAAKVYTAYKDAPSDYKNIAEEVRSLEGIINKAAQHFRSAALSDNDLQVGQEALKGCQSVLRDLNSLIEKYGSLASTNTGQVFQRVKLGTEDIATLRARLTSNATLLSSFIRRFDISTVTISHLLLTPIS